MGANVQGLQYAGLQGIAKKIEITVMVNQMGNMKWELGTIGPGRKLLYY